LRSAICGKIANEIVNLQRTEIGELSEGAAPGAGGSSTMPQKRNPMLAQNVVALGPPDGHQTCRRHRSHHARA
jgi:3-carboxy-cis,cis-muconate cycloisomerase